MILMFKKFFFLKSPLFDLFPVGTLPLASCASVIEGSFQPQATAEDTNQDLVKAC